MPKATVSTEATRVELKALPGGFVMLRKMSYGEILERRERASQMSMEATGKKADQKMSIEIMQQWTRWYEFRKCIVDHNLEDDNGVNLDFGNQMTMSVLDPIVGAEIERHIEEMNQEPDEDEQAKEVFTSASSASSKGVSESNGSESSTLKSSEKLTSGSE